MRMPLVRKEFTCNDEIGDCRESMRGAAGNFNGVSLDKIPDGQATLQRSMETYICPARL